MIKYIGRHVMASQNPMEFESGYHIFPWIEMNFKIQDANNFMKLKYIMMMLKRLFPLV
jgi:hypothetical protein